MRLCFVSILIVITGHISCAQQMPINADTSSIAPNTIRIIGKIKNIESETFAITIQTVVKSGQGVITILNEGQHVDVRTSGREIKIKPGQIVQADLKEKLSVDGSQSSYSLLRLIN